MAPSRTRWRTRSYFGAKHSSSAYISFRFWALHVAIISSASSSVRHSGFSMMTCLPAFAAAIVSTRVQVVRQADVHDLAVRACDRLVEIREPSRDPVLVRKRAGTLLGPRIDANHFGVRHETVVGLGMNVRDESGTEQQDFGSAHVVHVAMASVGRGAAARRNS